MGTRPWAPLAHAQAGLLSHRQLRELGVTRGEVRNHLRVGRWERDDITILVGTTHSFEPLPGYRFFRTRRPYGVLLGAGALPTCRLEPAVLMFAAHEPHVRTALGCVAASVQQRLTTADALVSWIDRLAPLRRSRDLRALTEVSCGAHSMAEVDLRRACRTFGVVPPRSQRSRRDNRGMRRYTDAEWLLPDGRVLVLEVDGGFHDDPTQSTSDRRRNRRLTHARRIVVQCSAWELRHEPAEVMHDLVALGVPTVG